MFRKGILFFILLVCSGCMDIETRIKINENGSGTLGIGVITDPLFAEMLKDQAFIQEDIPVKVRNFIKDGRLHHMEELVFSNIQDFTHMREVDIKTLKKNVRIGGRKNVHLYRIVFSDRRNIGKVDENTRLAAAMFAGYFLNFVIELPGRLEHASLLKVDTFEIYPEIDGNRITWKIPISVFALAESFELSADFVSKKLPLDGFTEFPDSPAEPEAESESDKSPITEADECYVTYFKVKTPMSRSSEGEVCVGWTSPCGDSIFTNQGNTLTEEQNCFKVSSRKDRKEIEIAPQGTFKTIYRQELIFENDTSCGQAEMKRNIAALIQKYAPVLVFGNDEKYYPTTIESLFDDKESLEQTAAGYNTSENDRFENVTFGKKDKASELFDTTSGKELGTKMLSHRGASDSFFAFNGQKFISKQNEIAVYSAYKTYPNKRRGNQLAIQYWFFYPFDPKQTHGEAFDSKPHSLDDFHYPTHHGDWEMITILFDDCTSDYSDGQPSMVGFSQHLPGQKIKCMWGECEDELNGNMINFWQTPGLAIPWEATRKLNNHVKVFVAKGSHASYPMPGTYQVHARPDSWYKKNFAVQNELAGGGYESYPAEYDLVVLPKMCEVTSDHPFGWLLFSGEINQEYLGKGRHVIHFPSHDDRWLDPKTWVEDLHHPVR